MGQARRNGRRVLAGCGRASERRCERNIFFIMGDDIGFMRPIRTFFTDGGLGMPSSAVHSFTDPDEYATSIHATTIDLTVVRRDPS